MNSPFDGRLNIQQEPSPAARQAGAHCYLRQDESIQITIIVELETETDRRKSSQKAGA